MAGATARARVDWRPKRRRVRCALLSGPHLRRHDLPRQRPQRGLPLPQCVGARGRLRRQVSGPGQAAGHVLDLWRRLYGGRHLRAAPGRREPLDQRCGSGELQLPPGYLRLLRASRRGQGIPAQRGRQLRPSRPTGRAPMGARQHRALRRRPGQRDHLRRIGRLVVGERPGGLPAGQGPVQPRHRRERRILPRRDRASAPRRGRAGGPQAR